MVSYGDCGAQLVKNQNRIKRTPLSHRVSMGHEQLYHGQVPWQALLWSDVQHRGRSLKGYASKLSKTQIFLINSLHSLK